jgi:hypothetical protein
MTPYQRAVGEGSGQPLLSKLLLHRWAAQVSETIHLHRRVHSHRHVGLDPLQQVGLEVGPMLSCQAGQGGVPVPIAHLNGHSYGATLDVMAIHGDEVIDRDVKLNGRGVDGKHPDRAKRGEQARRQVLTRELKSRRAVLLKQDSDGVRLDSHHPVQGTRLAGELHAERRLFSESRLWLAGGSRQLPISNNPTEQGGPQFADHRHPFHFVSSVSLMYINTNPGETGI